MVVLASVRPSDSVVSDVPTAIAGAPPFQVVASTDSAVTFRDLRTAPVFASRNSSVMPSGSSEEYRTRFSSAGSPSTEASVRYAPLASLANSSVPPRSSAPGSPARLQAACSA